MILIILTTIQSQRKLMFGIGMPEFLVVTIIFLLVFGVGKLPEVGGGIGKAIKNFKNETSENEHDIKSAEAAGSVKPR